MLTRQEFFPAEVQALTLQKAERFSCLHQHFRKLKIRYLCSMDTREQIARRYQVFQKFDKHCMDKAHTVVDTIQRR